jgi:hypothetical protein
MVGQSAELHPSHGPFVTPLLSNKQLQHIAVSQTVLYIFDPLMVALECVLQEIHKSSLTHQHLFRPITLSNEPLVRLSYKQHIFHKPSQVILA